MMRRILTITVFVAILIAIVFISKLYSEKAQFDELNSHVDIYGFHLLDQYNESLGDNPNYYEIGGFGGLFYSHVNDEIQIVYSGYPDVLDDYRLTALDVKAGMSSVFGIGLGSTFETMEKTMESYGYEMNEEDTSEHSYLYEKGKISIRFVLDDNRLVDSFYIDVLTTNKKDIVF